MNQQQEQAEFEASYPELLRNHSVYNAIVGGEFLFGRMNFFERFLVRKISGVTSNTSRLKHQEIENIANSINHEKNI
jgi:menaquinone-dependent protoporphyrinogen oxidase